jgi:hypothetical protein
MHEQEETDYDDGECVQCYLTHNGGKIIANKRDDLCLGCFHALSKNSNVMNTTLQVVLSNTFNVRSTCYRCKGRCAVWIDVSVCEECEPTLIKFETEKDLLDGWAAYIETLNPDHFL